LIGRGSADMKGPVASALAAAAAIRRAGIDLAGTLTFHLAADEEHMGIYGTKVLWDRGMLVQDACIVGEPSDLRVGLAERGGAWITATARGTAAHGSQPDLGVNAIASMSRLVLRLAEVLPDREHPLVGRPSVNAAVIAGGSAPNVVPDRCELVIDRRIVPGETDPAQVLHRSNDWPRRSRRTTPTSIDVPDRRLDRRRGSRGRLGHRRTCSAGDRRRARRGPGRRRLHRNHRRPVLHQRRHIPTVIVGPGSLSVAHTANEWVLVDDLVAAARIYARIFIGFLGARTG
jgi:acetylornithine deacetylase/succinyl-diaminopimelate desuccinylase